MIKATTPDKTFTFDTLNFNLPPHEFEEQLKKAQSNVVELLNSISQSISYRGVLTFLEKFKGNRWVFKQVIEVLHERK